LAGEHLTELAVVRLLDHFVARPHHHLREGDRDAGVGEALVDGQHQVVRGRQPGWNVAGVPVEEPEIDA